MAPLTNTEGVVEKTLGELKFVHVGRTRYSKTDIQHAGCCRSMECCADDVHRNNVKSACGIDRAFGGVAAGAVVPLEARLGMFGEAWPLVVGAFGEHSSGLHSPEPSNNESKSNSPNCPNRSCGDRAWTGHNAGSAAGKSGHGTARHQATED